MCVCKHLLVVLLLHPPVHWLELNTMPAVVAANDNDLQESLLGDRELSSTTPERPAQHNQQQLIHYQPFSVDTFIQWVLQSWLAFLSEWSGQLGL